MVEVDPAGGKTIVFYMCVYIKYRLYWNMIEFDGKWLGGKLSMNGVHRSIGKLCRVAACHLTKLDQNPFLCQKNHPRHCGSSIETSGICCELAP